MLQMLTRSLSLMPVLAFHGFWTRLIPFETCLIRFGEKMQTGWTGYANRVTKRKAIAGWQAAAVCLSAVVLLDALGCSSGSNTKAGAISVTDPNGVVSGQLTSLTVGTAAKVSMNPVNDKINTGVDWSIICGGSPITGSTTGGACGTLTPAHMPDGGTSIYTAPSKVPLGNTVILTAAVTSDPAASSSVTLTITPPAIVLVFASTPASSVYADGTTDFEVQLTNDTTSAGATWSAACGLSACGSFSKTVTSSGIPTTYTAPATVPSNGVAVTITATSVADVTKSTSTKITVLPVLPITISISPTAQLQLGTGASASLIATVVNDVNNEGVDWTVSCGSATGACGRLTPSTKHTASGAVVTYTAPNSASGVGTVTITADATAAPAQTAAATATVTTTPTISVALIAPSSLSELSSTSLTATVTKDTSDAGVSWAVNCNSPGACGSIASTGGSGASFTATYTAPTSIPAGGQVTVSATPLATILPGNPGMATIGITAVPPTVTFLQQPPSSMPANTQAPVSAVVTNGVPPGGVTWTVQCGSSAAGACGYILPYQTPSGNTATYTAPPSLPSGPVTIVATSTASPGVNVSSIPVTVQASTALSLRFIPTAPSQLQAGATVNLNAAVSNDSTSAGVDWQVCASGCGFFTTTPAIPAVPATSATPYIPAVPAVTATTVSAWSNGLPIPFTAPSTSSPGAMTITATAHADGKTSSVASVTITPNATGPTLQGLVQAGTQPVAGASVSLYAAGTSGYGSASTLLYAPGGASFATTDKNGNFTVSSGYSCPNSSSQVYLVAAGGQVGSYGPNPNLTLMAALGPCSDLSSSPIVINEVTTVASAWALAPFAANDALNGNSSYFYLGSSNGNTAGLANAFAVVNNLVNLSAGQALFSVPTGNATVPYAEINTLADILNTCTASGGGAEGDGSPCGTLFTAADPLSYNPGFNSTPPQDTLQAAFNIAQHPTVAFGYQITPSYLFGLASLGSPFQPILNATPNDFSIALNFTSGGEISRSSNANFFALDAAGNLWIANAAGNSVVEWNDMGTAVSPSGGFTTSSLIAPGPIAMDSTGNAWICGANGLTELNSLGIEVIGSPFSGGGLTNSCQAMAFDGAGNLWINNTYGVSKFNSLGVALSPAEGYTVPVSPTDNTTVSLLPPLAIDDSNNVWVGGNSPDNSGYLSLAELNDASGLANYLSPNPTNGTPASNFVQAGGDQSQTQIAIDGSGNVWVPDASNSVNGLTKVKPYGGIGTTDQTTVGFSTSSNNPLANQRGIAIDGLGMIWIASAGGTGNDDLPAGLAEISPANSSTYANYESPSLANRALSVAIDNSGNIWVLLNNNTITEYVGLAAPAVTPLSLAVKNKKLGAMP